MVNLNSLKGKVANGGVSEEGVLSSDNWNLLVDAVDELQGETTTAKSDASDAKTEATAAMTKATTALERATSALSNTQIIENEKGNDRVALFGGVVETGTIRSQSTTSSGVVVYVKNRNSFALRIGLEPGATYYNNWPGADRYFGEGRSVPRADQLYILGKKIYVYDDSIPDLVLASDIDNVLNLTGGHITGSITLDGELHMGGKTGSACIDMNQRYIENLPAPEEPNDAATKRYVDQTVETQVQIINESLEDGRIALFDGIRATGNILAESALLTEGGTVVYVANQNTFAYAVISPGVLQPTLYNNWPGAHRFFSDVLNRTPRTDQLYVCGKKIYLYDADKKTLVLASDIDGIRRENNVCNVCDTIGVDEFDGLVDAIGQMNEAFINDNELASLWRRKGVVFMFKNTNGRWESYQWDGSTVAQFIDLAKWRRFGGSTINAYEESEWGENGENINLIEGEFYGILDS